MKYKYLSLVFFLVFTACNSKGINTVVQNSEYSGIIFDSKYTVRFSETEIASIVDFIPNTTNITGWTPSIRNIELFEATLSGIRSKEVDLSNWFRQYIGYELNGRRYIWINFVYKNDSIMADLKEIPVFVSSLETQQFVLTFDIDRNKIFGTEDLDISIFK